MKREQKGITLIALIITIIVMLILVGVTINVALNGGIFNKATDAKTKTQKEADREKLLSSVYATVDNRGNLQIEDEENGLESNLPEGWNLEPSSNANYLACTSAKGTILYVNKETGAILDVLPQVVPEEPVAETNPWKLSPRSLTSSNVVFDARYSSDGAIRDENIILYSNGGFYSGNEVPSSTIDSYITAGYIAVGTDYVILPYGGEELFLLVFDDVGSLKYYRASISVGLDKDAIISGDTNGPETYTVLTNN